MKSNIRRINRACLAGGCSAVAAALLGGCSELINPYVDEVPATSEVYTASVAGVQQADTSPVMRVRDFEPAYVSAQDGTVSHWPLGWEDPLVDRGSADGQYALTWEDYVAIPYGLGRSLVNTMGWPISVAVLPPYTVMGSDGVLSRQALGYDHDAARLPGGLAPPIDILEVGTIPPDAECPPVREETPPPTESPE